MTDQEPEVEVEDEGDAQAESVEEQVPDQKDTEGKGEVDGEADGELPDLPSEPVPLERKSGDAVPNEPEEVEEEEVEPKPKKKAWSAQPIIKTAFERQPGQRCHYLFTRGNKRGKKCDKLSKCEEGWCKAHMGSSQALGVEPHVEQESAPRAPKQKTRRLNSRPATTEEMTHDFGNADPYEDDEMTFTMTSEQLADFAYEIEQSRQRRRGNGMKRFETPSPPPRSEPVAVPIKAPKATAPKAAPRKVPVKPESKVEEAATKQAPRKVAAAPAKKAAPKIMVPAKKEEVYVDPLAAFGTHRGR